MMVYKMTATWGFLFLLNNFISFTKIYVVYVINRDAAIILMLIQPKQNLYKCKVQVYNFQYVTQSADHAK